MTFYDKALSYVEEGRIDAVRVLSDEFRISLKTASDRFKSLFGVTAREYIKNKFTPTKEECDLALALSDTVDEMKERLNLRAEHYWVGLLDRYYGVSNFQKAKAAFVNQIPCEAYNPTLSDNKAILMSQLLGDGSYDSKRNAIRIEHGFKQRDYLLFKIGLFNKAWPTTNGIEKVREYTRDNGYVSYSWYSGRLPSSLADMIPTFEDLTPFGAFLFYLDDGCYHVSKTGQQIVSLAISKPELRQEALSYFHSYGIQFNERDKDLALQDSVRVAEFFRNFVRPFAHMVPECVQYKCRMKIKSAAE